MCMYVTACEGVSVMCPLVKELHGESCPFYLLQKLDYLLKRADSNSPIYKKDLPCSPALGNKFRKFGSVAVLVHMK